MLFLDELPEFDRRVLEALREPLETGVVSVSRARRRAEFPARFQLVAAMNPCPCGYHGDPSGRCRCTPEQVRRYRGKLSGPLLDRMDLVVEVPLLEPAAMLALPGGEASATVRARVEGAHQRQSARQGCPNSRLAPRDIDHLCRPDSAGGRLLEQAINRMKLSARAYHRVLKVARTIADLDGAEQPGPGHIAEAIQYRRGLDEI